MGVSSVRGDCNLMAACGLAVAKPQAAPGVTIMKYALACLPLSLLILAAFSAPAKTADNEDARLTDFFKAYLETAFRLRPSEATRLGDHRFDHLLDDISAKRGPAGRRIIATRSPIFRSRSTAPNCRAPPRSTTKSSSTTSPPRCGWPRTPDRSRPTRAPTTTTSAIAFIFFFRNRHSPRRRTSVIAWPAWPSSRRSSPPRRRTYAIRRA